MSREDAEKKIAENGPRVREAYGWDYFYGWCAGIRSAAEDDSE